MADKLPMILAIAAFLALSACVTGSYNQAYDKAFVYGGPPGPYDGVALYLHGCGGDSPEGDWLLFMIDRGFAVIPIRSMEDPRPPYICPKNYHPQKRVVKNQIHNIRLRQAKYAIEQIRIDHPGKKIVVWGFSEGSAVANLLDVPVDGILTTGYWCGWRDSGGTKIRKDVPWLALIGGSDPIVDWVEAASGYGSVRALCERVQDSPNWTYLIEEHEAHRQRISNPRIRAAAEEFLASVKARP